MDDAGPLVATGGVLAYTTCSLLGEENRARIEQFLQRNIAWKMISDRQFTPLDGGDGFYLALLTREVK